jgi:hypothetical protein
MNRLTFFYSFYSFVHKTFKTFILKQEKNYTQRKSVKRVGGEEG